MNGQALLASLHLDWLAATAAPNPAIPFDYDRGSAAVTARSYGAVTRRNRFGCGGAWVGFDYLGPDDRVILESMSATPH